MRLLCDSDIWQYQIGFTVEDVTEEHIVRARVDELVSRIVDATQADEISCYLTASGKQGFRYEVDPNYKGNRTQPKPKWFQFIKKYLISEYKAEENFVIETDDRLSIEQYKAEPGTTMVASIDKDILIIEGYHYRWPIMRKGKEIKPEQFIFIDELEGYKNFFKGLVIGDVADNIIGVRGIGHKKAEDLLGCCESDQEMFDVVREQYNDDERMLRNGQLMWLLRSETDKFTDRWKEWVNGRSDN